jgi:hypothetical protein
MLLPNLKKLHISKGSIYGAFAYTYKQHPSYLGHSRSGAEILTYMYNSRQLKAVNSKNIYGMGVGDLSIKQTS